MPAEIPSTSCRRDPNWLAAVLAGLDQAGCAVVLDALSDEQVERAKAGLYGVRDAILATVGEARLRAAGELGVLRLPMLHDPWLLSLLELPPLLAVVDAFLSPTAILHLQNGFILPSLPGGQTPSVFQNRLHRDFPRYLNGARVSLNGFLALTEFSQSSGGTRVVPGSHQQPDAPSDDALEQAVSVCCPAGAMIVFDSTLWHAAGVNTSGRDRLSINHQFTPAYIKQQMDYPRALGSLGADHPVERTRQLLGYWTRPPASLEDYYVPADQRLYRSGQG